MTRVQQGCRGPGAGEADYQTRSRRRGAWVHHTHWSLVCLCAAWLTGCGPASPPAPPQAAGPQVTLGGSTDTPAGGLPDANPTGTASDDLPTGDTAAGDTASGATADPTPATTSKAGSGASPAETPSGESSEAGEGTPPRTGTPAVAGDKARGNPAATAGGTPAAGGGSAAATPAAERTFRAEGPNGALRVTYDDFDLLKVLQMEPVTVDCVERMPAWLRALDGKPVRLRGYMKPGFLSEGITRFLLVRDTGLCCYGPKGKIYDLVQVTLAEGQSTNYIELTPFDVVGTFRVRLDLLDEEAEDGTVNQLIIGLYHIENGRILRK